MATNDSAVTDQGQPVSVDVLANDSDIDGNPLTVTSVMAPVHGSAAISGNTASYAPAAGYSGQDSFAYTISDGRGGTATATVVVQVNSVNKAPVAGGQSVDATEDVPLSIVLGATDDNGDLLTYSIVSGPSHGVLAGAGNNTTYTPEPDFNGQDGFTFKANDGMADSNSASVSIAVHAVNDAPVASSQSIANDEDSPVNIALSASDVDGDALSYSIEGPAHGTISGTAPDLTYTPDSNYEGQDSFTFVANDGLRDSNVATVTIAVNAVNDGPVAMSGSATIMEDSARIIMLDATDADGDPLTYTIVQNPTHGTLSAGSGGERTYAPAANYN
ncbi:MAG: Ig-like domain-containing protein, partial [Nitrososphaera sp.]